MSLPIAWVLKDKHILLIGGGEVAETRVRKLVPEQCKLVVVSPTLTPYIQQLHEESKLEWVRRKYTKSDLKMKHWSFVLTAIDDHNTSESIAHRCRRKHIPVNVADVIPLCDFYFGANFQQGPLKVMVSTGSGAPRLAKRVLNELSHHAAKFRYGDAISNVSKLRHILRQQLPQNHPKVSQTRMRLMKSLCDRLTFSELAELKEEEMRPLVRGMILSTAACPAMPAGEVDLASDFVDESGEAKEAEREDKSKTTGEAANVANAINGDVTSTTNENNAGSGKSSSDSSNDISIGGSVNGSSEDSDSDDSDNDGSDSDGSDNDSDGSDSDSSDGSGNGRGNSNGSDGSSDRSMSDESGPRMKRKATECAPGFPQPKIPSFPFSQIQPRKVLALSAVVGEYEVVICGEAALATLMGTSDDESFSNVLDATQDNITRISRNVALVASAMLNSGDVASVGSPSQYHRAMTDMLGYRKRMVASKIKDQTPRQAIQQSLVRRLGGGMRAPLVADHLLLDVPEPRTQHSLFQTYEVTAPYADTAADQAFALSVRKEMAASELMEIDERIAELRSMRKLVFDRMADVEREQTSDERTLQHYYPRGERIKQFQPQPNSRVSAVDFNSPFGQLALAFDDEIALYELNTDTHTRLRGTVGHTVRCVSVRGSDPVVACGAQHNVYLWHPQSNSDTSDMAEPAELIGHVGDVVVVDNDGETLVTSSLDSTVRQWDERLGKCSTTIDMFEFGTCRALQHTGSALATGTADGVVRLFDLRQPVSRQGGKANSSRELLGGHTKAVTALQFHGLELVSGCGDGSMRIWDLRNGQISTAEAYPGAINSLQFDSSKVVASVEGELGVRVLSRPTGEHRISAIDDAVVTAARYMKGYLVTGRADGSVGVYAV